MVLSRRDLLASAAAFFQFSGDVKVVNVLASVRNGKGEVVKDLKQDDFTLEDDGRPQVIKYFSRETDLPLTLGLMVDTSGSQRGVLDKEKAATSKFIEQVIREDKDQAFLIKFDAEAELMQDLTPSRKRLQSALNAVEGAAPRQLQRREGPPTGGRAGTVLYDSVLLASDEEMKKQKGRKALILLTDGEDRGSKVSLTDSIEAAQRADTLVYSILFADQEQPLNHGRGGRWRMPRQQARGEGKKILQRISKETGGAFFEVSRKTPIETIYEQIEEELRSQYNIGYTPDKFDAGFHKIKVTAKGKGLVVQARDGYYATA